MAERLRLIRHLMGNWWNGLNRQHHNGKEESKDRSYVFDFPWEGHMALLLRRNVIIPGVIPKERCAVLRERPDLVKAEVLKFWDAECRNRRIGTKQSGGKVPWTSSSSFLTILLSNVLCLCFSVPLKSLLLSIWKGFIESDPSVS